MNYPQYPYNPTQPTHPYAYNHQTPYPAYNYAQPTAPQYGTGNYSTHTDANIHYASWLTRAGAFLIDYFFMGVILRIVQTILVAIEHGDGGVGSFFDVKKTNHYSFSLWLPVLIVMVYYAIPQGITGQTIGKKILNIRLVAISTGKPIGAILGIVRQICHIADVFSFFIGYFTPLFSSKKQTFADMVVRSIVVRANPRSTENPTPPHYQPNNPYYGFHQGRSA